MCVHLERTLVDPPYRCQGWTHLAEVTGGDWQGWDGAQATPGWSLRTEHLLGHVRRYESQTDNGSKSPGSNELSLTSCVSSGFGGLMGRFISPRRTGC